MGIFANVTVALLLTNGGTHGSLGMLSPRLPLTLVLSPLHCPLATSLPHPLHSQEDGSATTSASPQGLWLSKEEADSALASLKFESET